VAGVVVVALVARVEVVISVEEAAEEENEEDEQAADGEEELQAKVDRAIAECTKQEGFPSSHSKRIFVNSERIFPRMQEAEPTPT